MSSLFLKHYKSLYLLLPILLGLALGHLAATVVGMRLSATAPPPPPPAAEQAAPKRKPTLPEYQGILSRNLFDSTAPGAGTLGSEEAPEGTAAAPPASRSDLTLFGTIVRGKKSLAVIGSDKGVRTYFLQGEIPGGGKVASIERNRVEIEYEGGNSQTLSLLPEKQAAAPPEPGAPSPEGTQPPPAPAGASIFPGVRAVGPNKFVIPKDVAEQARGNINELLKQARMEPNIVEGRTEGFVVRMVQPKSILAVLGIQRGDILRQINGVELDSPEKALQIFQQLREARNISISLQRGGNNLSYEYEVD